MKTTVKSGVKSTERANLGISSYLIAIVMILLISGSAAFASHTASVTVSPQYVAGEETSTYTFEVTNDGAADVYYIYITVPSEFSNVNSITCPLSWTPTYSEGKVKCDWSIGKGALTSGNYDDISFSATTPNPAEDTQYAWDVTTYEAMGANPSTNSDAKTTVDVTAPTASATPTGTLGTNGWYTSSVSIALSADDGSGSGVSAIKYSIDGGSEQTYSAPFTVLGDGAHTITYYSIDQVNNIESEKSQTIKIDTVAPTTLSAVPGTYGVDGWLPSGVFASLSGSDANSGVAATYYTIDGGESQTYSIPILVSTEGIHPIVFHSVDVAGNVEADKTINVKIDQTAPSTSEITAPSAGYYKGTIIITADAADALSGVQKVEFYKDEVLLSTDNNGVDGWSHDWPTTASDDGLHALMAKVYDNAGNSLTSSAVSVTVDNTNPTVALTYSPNRNVRDADTLIITASFTDSNGIDETNAPKISIDYTGTDADVTDAAMTPVDNKHWTYPADIPAGNNGTATVTISAKDVAGNSNDAATNNQFTVDNTPPEITSYSIINPIFSPNSDGVKDTATIDVTFSETSDYEIKIKNSLEVTVKSWSGQDVTNPDPKVWDGTGNTGDGNYTVEITTTDEAGNSIIDTSRTITLDTTLPTITSINSPATSNNPTFNITYEASDGTGSGVDAVKLWYKITGGVWTEYGSYQENTGTLSFTVPAAGNYDFYIQPKDNAGNENSAQTPTSSTEVMKPTIVYVNTSGDGGHILNWDAFNTIQAGIDAVATGGTVNVAAGIYTESVTVNKAASIVGEGNTATIIQPTVDQDAIIITADDVLIKDVKISTSNTGVTPNIAIKIQETDNVEINNNVIETTGNKAMGIWIGGSSNGLSPSSNLVIIKNAITIDGEATGIYAAHSNPAHSGWIIGGTSADANTITANSGNPVELYDVSNSEVSYNTLTISASGGSNVIWSSELSDIQNLVFNNNAVTGSGGSQVAFITDFIDSLNVGDILPSTTITTVTITGNTFSNWGSRALRIGDGDGTDTNTVTGITINSNTFNMNTDTEVIGGTATDKTGTENTFNVNTPAKIQKAIDSAFSGDTVNVAAGTYTETLAISKGVALQGTGASNVTLNGDITLAADGVTIDGFTLVPNSVAISIDSSANAINNVDVTNNIFAMSSSPGVVGVWVGGNNPVNSLSNVTVSYNTFNGPTNKICNPFKIGGQYGTPQGAQINTFDFEHNAVNRCSAPVNLQDKNINGLTINDNTFRDTDGVLYMWAQAGTAPTGVLSNFVFTNNDVDSSNSYGIGISDSALNPIYTDLNFGTGNKINDNEFVEVPGDYGFKAVSILSSLTAYKLDAKNNWWGSRQKSDVVGSVSENVDYEPWYLDPATKVLSSTDDTHPTVVLSDNIGARTVVRNGDTVIITANFSDDNGLDTGVTPTITITNGGVSGDITSDMSGSGNIWTYEWNVPTGDYASAKVSISAKDIVGNANSAATGKTLYAIDNTAPLITIDTVTTPTNITTQTITGTFTEQNLDKIFVNGNEATVYENRTFSKVIDLIGGTNNINITAIDFAGNRKEDTSKAITLDIQAPSITNIVQTPEHVRLNTPVTISATVADNIDGVGVNSVVLHYRVNGSAFQTISMTVVSGITYAATIPTTGFTDGAPVDYYITADDKAGNSQTSDSNVFIVDGLAPSLTSYSPSTGAVGVDTATTITLIFSEDMDQTTFSGVALKDSNDNNVLITLQSYDDATHTAVFKPSATLGSNKGYSVTLTELKDLAGNALSDKSWSFTTATSYSISLSKKGVNGWNLISLPVIPADTSIENVLSDVKSDVLKVWTYDAVNSKWYMYAPNDPASDLTDMTAGYGYWINYNNDAQKAISGSGSLFLEGANTPPQRTLTSGWNLIGYYQRENTDAISASCALKTLRYPDWWTMLTGYNNANKGFTSVKDTDNMNPGQAYWIFMTSEKDKYQYGPGLPSPCV